MKKEARGGRAGRGKVWAGIRGTYVDLHKAFTQDAPADVVYYFVDVVLLPDDASQVLYMPASALAIRALPEDKIMKQNRCTLFGAIGKCHNAVGGDSEKPMDDIFVKPAWEPALSLANAVIAAGKHGHDGDPQDCAGCCEQQLCPNPMRAGELTREL